MNRKIQSFILISSFVLSIPMFAFAAPFQNGSFEDGAYPGGQFATLSGGSTVITGWTVGGNSIDWISGYWQPSDGSKSIDIDGNSAGSISQTFDTIPNTSYHFSFDLAGNPDRSYDKVVVVVAGDNFNQSFTFVQGTNSKENMGWTTQYFDFFAKGGSTTLTFSSDTAGAWGAAIDNVRLVYVPEPLTILLLGLGLVGIAGFGRRIG